MRGAELDRIQANFLDNGAKISYNEYNKYSKTISKIVAARLLNAEIHNERKMNMKKTNHNSPMKRIAASATMLATSAAMLGTSTYAWFTMSREVEVKNIQMTATVPEDIQISLGEITGGDDSTINLAKSTGTLALDTNNAVKDPSDIYDWSNTVDISAYYQFGKLIPASSTDGVNVYYTPDADGVGKTVKANAAYYDAVLAGTINKTNDATGGNATAHTFTASEKTGTATTGSWTDWVATTNENGYKKGTAWNGTNDDGYYIDVPVWLRTSSTAKSDGAEGQNIYVTGFVKKGTSTASGADEDADDTLYQAVRVAILKDNYSADGGCLNLADGAKVTANGAATYYSNVAQQTTAATQHILDSDIYNGRVTPAGTGINAHASAADACTAITQNDGTTAVASLTPGTGTEYGTATKLIIRVWLEGEDGDCWNENAGQDWDISLKFMKEALPAT